MLTRILSLIIFIVGCVLLLIAHGALVKNDEALVLVYMAGFTLAVTGLVGILYALFHYVFFGPIERRERGRFFLELLSLAEKSEQSIEQTIISFSRSGKRPLDEQFDRVARHVESGLNLSEALTRVPGCLPDQVVATLQVGHETGGVSTTLPAAQEYLREKDKYNYWVFVYNGMILFVAVLIAWVLMTYVVPQFEQIATDMGMLGPENATPGFLAPEYSAPHLKGLYGVVNQMIAPVFDISNIIKDYWGFYFFSFFFGGLLLYLNIIFIRYVGGPRLIDQLKVPFIIATGFSAFFLFITVLSFGPWPFVLALCGSGGYIVISLTCVSVWYGCEQMGWFDPFRLLLPWRRKRLQRDYSHMLALLLDSGLPEEKAVQLAARSTSNHVLKKRAGKVIASLQSGLGLTEAIKLMDNSREFQWRLTNALQTEGNFVDALSGWHRSLSTRADRQQQTFETMWETSVLLFLGLCVFCVVAGCWQFIQHMTMELAW